MHDVVSELEWRGLVHQVTDSSLAAMMAAEPFALYHGIDVTADSLHVGNLMGIVALQRFQRAGHRPIVVVGGGTTRIGDPSGKRAERPLLSAGQIAANAAGVRAQVERFVDFGDGPAGARMVDNADWLCDLPLIDFLRDTGKHFTVNAMVAKEAVRSRFETVDQGISFTEFSYMLLQAHDYLHLFDTEQCRLQVGGSDQWGNITAGVDLIRRTRGEAAYGLTWPLLTKADGTKFGKSEAGNVWLDPRKTSPYAFFQFWLNTDDADVGRLLRAFTTLAREDIDGLEASVAADPAARQAQRVLAREMTTAVHGEAEVQAAERAANALFTGELSALDPATLADVLADAPSSERQMSVLEGDGLSLVEVLAESGLTASRSAARTAVSQGGVRVNDKVETDIGRRLIRPDLLHGEYLVLRRGKRNYHLVRFR